MPSSSALPTKKRKFGSGEIPLDDIPFVETSFSEILEKINEVEEYDNARYRDLEEFDALKNGVSQVLNNVKKLKDLIKENPGFDVKAISFSKFDLDMLSTRLGATAMEIDSAITPTDLVERIVKALRQQEGVRSLDEMIRAVDEHPFANLLQFLHLIGGSVHTRSEARGRMLIDQWIFESMHISSCLEPKGYPSILFPELSIASLTRDPVKVTFENCITYITGSTDYALLSFPSASEIFRPRYYENVLHSMSPITVITPYETFMFFEAKREGESLDEHVPQVVAQCIAICTKVNTIRQMPFCLTTGQSWMFGIVDTAVSPNVFWTSSIFGNDNAPSTETVQPIMTLIILWKLQPAEVLMNAIRTLSRM